MQKEEAMRVVDALRTIRCGAACSEEELHALAAEAFAREGLCARHEAVIAPRCRIDFLVGRIGVEIKKSRPERKKLIAQLTRYAQSEQIDCLIVVAPRGVDLPASLGGKMVVQVALERLWGIYLP